MVKFIGKRILSIIPVLFGVTFLVYLLVKMAPGNPELTPLRRAETPEEKAQMREELGLNDPILVQYARMMQRVFFSESKSSIVTREKLAAHLPRTIQLSMTALVFSIIFALPLGLIAAIKQNTLFDGLSMTISLIGVSMPNFWLGIMLMILFTLKLKWLPSAGSATPQHIILPAMTLAVINMGAISRVTRSSVLEVIRQDYVRTARAKGSPQRAVIRKHVLRNALIPTVTVLGIQLGELLSGAIIVENVFAWPGVGRLLMLAIESRDITMMIGCVTIFALFISVINLIVDMLYSALDPRIQRN